VAYISSNNNRWYCQIEPSYGQSATIAAQNRFPAVSMSVHQKVQVGVRHDKTGTRTFTGTSGILRKQTSFDLSTYMTAWTNTSVIPAYGPLFQAALGAPPLFFRGGVATGASTPLTICFGASHGLIAGQAITFNAEIRFVASVIDQATVLVNAPFTTAPGSGSLIGQTVTFLPSTELPSVSIFDYWTPASAIQRLLCGCAMDKLTVSVNGDYHEFGFKGLAQDVFDTSTFVSGMGQISSYPPEPAIDPTPITVIPGHLGQAWLGPIASQFFTLTGAKLTLQNNLDARITEFGSSVPRAVNPGRRDVLVDLDLFGQDDGSTVSLYQAAKQRAPIVVALQLGKATGQLFGMYMKSVVPELPDFAGQETRQQWQFRGAQAQGLGDDEVAVAFG
jgi:hypothetical protein